MRRLIVNMISSRKGAMVSAPATIEPTVRLVLYALENNEQTLQGSKFMHPQTNPY